MFGTTFLQKWFLQSFRPLRGSPVVICFWLFLWLRLCISVASDRFAFSVSAFSFVLLETLSSCRASVFLVSFYFFPFFFAFFSIFLRFYAVPFLFFSLFFLFLPIFSSLFPFFCAFFCFFLFFFCFFCFCLFSFFHFPASSPLSLVFFTFRHFQHFLR